MAKTALRTARVRTRAPVERVRALIDTARAARLAGDHRLGADHAAQALALATNGGHKRLVTEALSVLALNELRLGDLEAATRHCLEGLALAKGRRDAAERAEMSCTLVMAYNEMGLHADALLYAAHAVEAARLTGDASLISWALNRAGLTHHHLGDHDRSEPLLLQALEMARTIDGSEETFSALNNLCSNLVKSAKEAVGAARQAKLVRALAFGTEALDHAERSGNAHREAVCLGNLANAHVALANYPVALDCIERQRGLAEKNGYRVMSLSATINRADLERHRGDLAAAIRLFSEALDLAHEVFDRATLFDLHLGLYESHKQRGEFADALRHHEAMLPLEREALQQRADRQARLLQNRIEIEKFHAMADRARLDAEVQRLRAAQLESQNEQLSSKAIELGRHALEDSLTGLANRRRIDGELPLQMALARERQTALTVAAIDLDHFKRVNDRHGHGVGDDVLREVARLLVANTRSTDLCARMGGEEFLVLLVGTPLTAALEICERLRQAIQTHAWGAIADRLEVTVSIGLCDAAGCDDMRALLARADASLYEAKHSGRNRVVVDGL